MAGLSQEQFGEVSQEILTAWSKAHTRDEGFHVIAEFGRKYGFKNVIAAIEGRTPRRYTREKSVSEWVNERHQEEAAE